MSSLGILVLNIDQEKDHFLNIAKSGVLHQTETYLFLPNKINPNERTFYGKKYSPKSDSWENGVFPLPMFIYDRCFYENEMIFKNHYSFVSWLKEQPNIYFLGHGLPNKWVVYNMLSQDDSLKPYLPKTNLLTSYKQLEELFTIHHSLLLKPVSGSQGRGIFIITNEKRGFRLIAKKKQIPYHRPLTDKQMKNLIDRISKKRKYIIQPYLTLSTNDQHPFDIRVYLQKDQYGSWIEIGSGIRIGKHGDFTSNISNGGEVYPYKNWLHSLPKDERNSLQKDLETISKKIPTVLEKHGQQLFEVGIDFGYDKQGRLWLLEVNSKPGRKVVLNNYPHKKEILAKGPILYCHYLRKTQDSS